LDGEQPDQQLPKRKRATGREHSKEKPKKKKSKTSQFEEAITGFMQQQKEADDNFSKYMKEQRDMEMELRNKECKAQHHTGEKRMR